MEWVAPEPEGNPDEIQDMLDAIATVYDKLIIVVSAESLAENWIVELIHTAYHRELFAPEGPRLLVLVGLTSRSEMAAAMESEELSDLFSRYKLHDFSRWTHQDTEEAFIGLLQDLSYLSEPS